MDLALATGRGPAVLSNIEGRLPLVRDEDVVAFGRRDSAEAAKHGSARLEDTLIRVMDLGNVRFSGARTCADRAVKHLTAPGLQGFWVHLDADVLDDAIMPAVDYRMPDGLGWDELTNVLQAAVASGRMAGIDITIFNPKLDVDGAIARDFVNTLAEGLVLAPR